MAKGRRVQPKTPKTEKKARAPRANRQRASRAKVGLIAAALVVGLLAVATVGMCGYAHFNKDVYPKVRVDGLLLGGMSGEEAAQALRAAGLVQTEDKTLTVHLPQDNTLTLSAEKAGALLDGETAAGIALAYGRDGGFFKNGFAWLRCAMFGARLTLKDAEANLPLNDEYIRAEIKAAALRADEAIMGSDMDIGETELKLVKGIGKVLVNEDALYAEISDALLAEDFSARS